ncbi:MAG: hypothetical protein OSA93_08875 [Akkermansiaceae bacterium]|nr:hypothetical protein [Akkermansiaceae bacterium]
METESQFVSPLRHPTTPTFKLGITPPTLAKRVSRTFGYVGSPGTSIGLNLTFE